MNHKCTECKVKLKKLSYWHGRILCQHCYSREREIRRLNPKWRD